MLPAAAAVFIMLGAGAGLAPVAYASHTLSPSDIMRLNAAVSDTNEAPEAVRQLRSHLGSDLDSGYVVYARQLLLRSLIVSKAPAKEILGAADTLENFLPSEPRTRVMTYAQVAQVLVERGEELKRAIEYTKKAQAACPKTAEWAGAIAACDVLIGQAQFKLGEYEKAIASFSGVLGAVPDSQTTLLWLGRSHEKRGNSQKAIDAYVRSLGVFASKDTSAATPLRALYQKQNGKLDGLDERIDTALKTSRKIVALDAHRDERDAPAWTLPDLTDEPVQLSDFKGKVVVLDFWGSWCGPCRMELPYFQQMYDKYKDKGVVFVGINWEQEKTRAAHLETAKNFVQSNNYSFPVVFDHDRSAVQSYAISAFPTVFMIDKSGRVRYRNVGVSQGIEDILTAQIESLLE